ncbi:helix-turn-helix domain-containing protein [Glutamicibacter sp. TV12E]|uniref:helix-turn-helix domain-containing protein n=1 Tax=Glutamicibacter sp. TV12E TaxID=3446362 RepID=UPI0040336943
MHELGRYLQRKIDDKGWTSAELARRAGVSRQTVYNLITDTRDFMDQTPQRKTINALADALNVTPMEILTVSAQALGIPIEALPPEDVLSSVTNEQILTELSSRLSRSKGPGNESTSTEATLPRHLRAVAPEGDSRPGQKIAPGEFEVTEIFGEEARNYPLPDLDQMAAHPNFKSKRQKWEEAYGERGEESQDSGEDL